jgi:hypothetical protein
MAEQSFTLASRRINSRISFNVAEHRCSAHNAVLHGGDVAQPTIESVVYGCPDNFSSRGGDDGKRLEQNYRTDQRQGDGRLHAVLIVRFNIVHTYDYQCLFR